ncbi:MAG: ribonuclease HII [Elusimicrobia bacterium RIFOXYB2_FULL_48_7]|nr:MAG: ribonuclease HII [Elusimicrobia bacterium RIFOXYB2_FULL_48_7]
MPTPCSLRELYKFDSRTRAGRKILIAGVDEAGRGPLAGPVVASAVILPRKNCIKGISDSKTLSESQREKAYALIKKRSLAFGVGVCSHKVIDEINIFRASYLAMKIAVKKLRVRPGLVLVDGPYKIPGLNMIQKPVIKGDARSACVAAASIVAKVTRDRIMRKYHEKYPRYGFDRHKGYPTKQHRYAIKQHGPAEIHRRSFTLN